MLTKAGLVSLIDGNFDGMYPVKEHCAGYNDVIAAIYTWAVVARGRAALGVTLMANHLKQDRYKNINLFSVPATNDGRRMLKSVGYVPLAKDQNGQLFRYQRISNRAA